MKRREISHLFRGRVDLDNRKISELRNLGPACERDLNQVGIYTADDIRQLGIEETFERMLVGRLSRGETDQACNATYLYALYGALHDLDWREIPAAKKEHFKKFTARLRAEIAGLHG